MQAETRFPLKVSPKFPLARSLREPSPGLGLGFLVAVRPQMRGRKRQEKETTLWKATNSACNSTHRPRHAAAQMIQADIDAAARATPGMASGEKSKGPRHPRRHPHAEAIEQEGRPATPEEKQMLARFSGFGPVALSIFPDPVTGKYKDARLAGHWPGTQIAADAGRIRQRQTHHLQRLLHLADRHRRDA